MRYYEFSGRLSLGKLLAGVIDPTMVASLSIPSWHQIHTFLESMKQLRESTGFAA